MAHPLSLLCALTAIYCDKDDTIMFYVHSFPHDHHRSRLATALQVDVFLGQLIKLAQVAFTSELLENQQNDLLIFKVIPSHICRASEASNVDCFKN